MRTFHKPDNLNYYWTIFKIFILYFLTISNLSSSENKIGSITQINGDVIAITESGDERQLQIFDEIYLLDEILVGDSSSATIQFNDSTTIILKELTSLNLTEFE